jgi:hypothetical protein
MMFLPKLTVRNYRRTASENLGPKAGYRSNSMTRRSRRNPAGGFTRRKGWCALNKAGLLGSTEMMGRMGDLPIARQCQMLPLAAQPPIIGGRKSAK